MPGATPSGIVIVVPGEINRAFSREIPEKRFEGMLEETPGGILEEILKEIPRGLPKGIPGGMFPDDFQKELLRKFEDELQEKNLEQFQQKISE